MHTKFAEWLNITNPNPSEDLINKRSASITAYLAEADATNALEIIRIFFKKPVKNQDIKESFLKHFTDQDTSFLKKDADVQLLAGITIAELLENKKGTLADTVALAVSCISFQEMIRDLIVPDILDACRTYLHQRSDSLRNILTLPALNPQKVPVETKDIQAKINESSSDYAGQIAEIVKTLPKIGTSSEKAVSALASQITTTVTSLSRALDLQREETNMLWWVFGGYSGDLDVPFVDLGPAIPIIGAKELSTLTRVIPGPVSIKALLRKIVDESQLQADITIESSLNACKPEWLQSWINQREIKGIGDICYIHYAGQTSKELGQANTWTDLFNKQAPVKANDTLDPIKLALQVYREASLLKLLGI
jgi:hypothetical protein